MPLRLQGIIFWLKYPSLASLVNPNHLLKISLNLTRQNFLNAISLANHFYLYQTTPFHNKGDFLTQIFLTDIPSLTLLNSVLEYPLTLQERIPEVNHFTCIYPLTLQYGQQKENKFLLAPKSFLPVLEYPLPLQ